MKEHVSSNFNGPVIIGGNGHSGTRVFCDIVTLGGVFTGIRNVTKRSESADLRIIDLLNEWVEPYVYGTLSETDLARMRTAFSRRFRLLFPLRGKHWGFKNPRTMLMLPFLDRLFPEMRFVHVIRDGRDIALGNPFVTSNRYVDAFLTDDERQLLPEEKMILFWGRSNQSALEYGTTHMGTRYLFMKWEDLCSAPAARTAELHRFAGCPKGDTATIAKIVRTPKSMGRWRTFPEDLRNRVASRGSEWLSRFGYEML